MSDRREDTFAAGLSMGGYGALKLGLRRSEAFSKVASLSGALDAAAFAQLPSRANSPFWTSIFGPLDQIPQGEDDLFRAASLLKESGKPLPEVYMWCGLQDGLLPQNHRMRDHLRSLGYPLVYEESEGGHRWDCWDERIRSVLRWIQEGR